MRAGSDGAPPRAARRRRGIPFRVQVGLVALLTVAIGYTIGYYGIAMLTMPQASPGDTPVSAPDRISLPAGSTGGEVPAGTAPPQGTAATPSSRPATPAPQAATGAAPLPEGGLYRVQVGAFNDRERAQTLADQLRARGIEASITSGPPYRVQAGAFRNETGAQMRLQELREAGFVDAFIQRTQP